MRRLLLTSLIACTFSLAAQAQCPPAKTPGAHVVQRGETLYRISLKYKVTVEQIRQWNNLKSDVIAVCQELRVSPTAAVPPSATGPATPIFPAQPGPTHIVQRGETVATIARLYGFTELRFRLFNQLKADQEVTQGMVLRSDDCQCPPLGQTGDWATTSYETTVQPTTGPSSMFATTAPTTQPTDAAQPTTPTTPTAQPAQQTETATAFTTAEEMLAGRRETAADTEKKAAVPLPSADFKPVVAPFLSEEERAMIDEINRVRSNPPGYIPVIEDLRRELAVRSTSDALVCDELIEALKNMKPLHALEPAECMYRITRQHGEDLQTGSALNHRGRDGSWPWDRVRSACQNLQDGDEIIARGSSSVRRTVALLLVDAAIPSRGQRRILLSKDWRFVSSYRTGPIGLSESNWVLNFGK